MLSTKNVRQYIHLKVFFIDLLDLIAIYGDILFRCFISYFLTRVSCMKFYCNVSAFCDVSPKI